MLATLYHVARTDEAPNHNMCSSCENTWCRWHKDPSTYKHGLPTAIVELLEPLYEELSHPQLLSKCLHGETHNPNECLNKLIWSRCPKEVWVSLMTTQQATNAAVAHFNDGNISFLNVLQHMGVDPAFYTMLISKKQDSNRIAKSNRHPLKIKKKDP